MTGWSEIEAAYERMQRESPREWSDYMTEVAEATAGEPDATAARDWPEYNR